MRGRGDRGSNKTGAIAQLGERVLCKHEVVGSIPSGSTKFGGLGAFCVVARPSGSTIRFLECPSKGLRVLRVGAACNLTHREEGT